MNPLGSSPVCRFCGHDNTAPVNSPVYHLPGGTQLHGRYVIGRALGEGGFGITYIGMDTTLSKRVAVKEFYPSGIAVRDSTVSAEVQVSDDKQASFDRGVERFLFEAKSVAAFTDEDGIVDVQDYFQENRTAYIVMNFLDGKNLYQYVADHGRFSFDKLIALLTPVMRALRNMHSKGIIHRDISPDNIMFTTKGGIFPVRTAPKRSCSSRAMHRRSSISATASRDPLQMCTRSARRYIIVLPERCPYRHSNAM